MALPPANVPDVPGVPALNFAAGAEFGIELLTGDTASYFSSQFGPQWGLFLDGEPAIVADSVISFEYRQEWSISDYAVEEGGFQSYNKVTLPFDCRFRFSAGGSESDRQALLDSVAAIAGTTTVYDAVTPEETYSSVCVSHYDYKRTATNGVGLIQVDVWAIQINQSGVGTTSSTAAPGAASQTNNGTVQTTTPTPAQTAAVPAVQ
jgi:hypothetical protein